MLEATDLVKRHGRVPALDGFTLHVRPGEIVGLVGHNGAGKTTFVDIVSGLVRLDAGRVRIGTKSPREARGDVGTASQQIALYPSATVREHLRLFGRLSGLRGTALRVAIDEVVAAMRLAPFLDRQVGVLSGGQQRRSQAATALLHRPGLLLLDEPTAGADPETRQALLDVLRDRARQGAAIVYTTHYLPEVTELQATIGVAREGRIIARGNSEQLLAGLAGEVRLSLLQQEIRVSTKNPAQTLVELLSGLREPVRSIDVRNPSLDNLYRSLAVTDA
ncbi:ABC transporter ATP-binding protein [Micromonospora sp. NPDC050187]|uniref:ABC transporter ATP-binding protein n=1 Tax=Micromonospora sp. NPDC050187 TaxID=3364277 RepID=UPI00379627B7